MDLLKWSSQNADNKSRRKSVVRVENYLVCRECFQSDLFEFVVFCKEEWALDVQSIP